MDRLAPRGWGLSSPAIREIARMWRDMDRMFETAVARTGEPGVAAGWCPALEMHQTEDEVIVRAELPGMKRDEITIDATEDGLSISGERKAPQHACSEGAVCCTEVCYGPFERTVAWPVRVQHAKAKATLADGVLDIRVPVAEEARPVKPTKVEIG